MPIIPPHPDLNTPSDGPTDGPVSPCRSATDDIEDRCYRESQAHVKLSVSDAQLGTAEPVWGSRVSTPVQVPAAPKGFDDSGIPMAAKESMAAAKPMVYQYFSAWGVYLRDFSASFIPCRHIDVSLFSFFQISDTTTCTVHSSDIGGDFQKGSSAQQITGRDPINKPVTFKPSANGSPYWESFFRSGNNVIFAELKRLCPESFQVAASVGGWTLSNHFTGCVADDRKLDSMMDSMRELRQFYPFIDHWDFDWEYPGKYDMQGNPRAGGPTKDTVLADMPGYIKLIQKTKATFPNEAVTAALSMNYKQIAWQYGPNGEGCQFFHELTTLNLMTYDFFGAWEVVTGFNAPLYGDPADPRYDRTSDFNSEGGVRYYVHYWEKFCRHLPNMNYDIRTKMMFGLASYGRSWMIDQKQVTKTIKARSKDLPGMYVPTKVSWIPPQDMAWGANGGVQAQKPGPGSFTDGISEGFGFGSLDYYDIEQNYSPNLSYFHNDVNDSSFLVGKWNSRRCCWWNGSDNDKEVMNDKAWASCGELWGARCTHDGIMQRITSHKDECAAWDNKDWYDQDWGKWFTKEKYFDCGDDAFFIAFDSPQDVARKAAWAKDQGMAGFMFWEASGDRQYKLLAAAYNGWGINKDWQAIFDEMPMVSEVKHLADYSKPVQCRHTACVVDTTWWSFGKMSDVPACDFAAYQAARDTGAGGYCGPESQVNVTSITTHEPGCIQGTATPHSWTQKVCRMDMSGYIAAEDETDAMRVPP